MFTSKGPTILWYFYYRSRRCHASHRGCVENKITTSQGRPCYRGILARNFWYHIMSSDVSGIFCRVPRVSALVSLISFDESEVDRTLFCDKLLVTRLLREELP